MRRCGSSLGADSLPVVAHQPLGKAALLAKYTHRSGLLSLLPSAGMATEHLTVVIQYWEGVYDVARINRTYMGQTYLGKVTNG